MQAAIGEQGSGSGWQWLTAVPIVLMMALAYWLYLPVPVDDYWDAMVPGWAAVREGPAALAAFVWRPFVDQTMVFPKLSIALLADGLAGRHLAVEIGLGIAAQVAVLWMLAAIARHLHLRARAHAALVGAAAFVLFWPAMMVRFQHHWYSTQYAWVTTAGVFALWALTTRWGTWLGWFGGMLGAVTSALSHGTGIFLLPAVGMLLLIAPNWSRAQRRVWWLLTLGLLGLLWAHKPSAAQVGLPDAGERLVAAWHIPTFFLRCMGPPWQQLLGGSLVFAGSTIVLWRLWRAKLLADRATFPWLALIAWGYLCAAATTMARLAEGKPAKWYFAFFALPTIATLVLGLRAWPGLVAVGTWAPTRRRHLRSMLVGMALVAWSLGAWHGLQTAHRLQTATLRAAQLLRFAPLLQPAQTRDIFPHPYFLGHLLADAVALGFAPGAVDLRAFDRQWPLEVLPTEANGLTANAGVDGLQLVATEPAGSLLLHWTEGIAPGEVLTVRMHLARDVVATAEWHDGSRWWPALRLQPPTAPDRTAWAFVDASGHLPHIEVREVRLRCRGPAVPGARIGSLEGWQREARSTH